MLNEIHGCNDSFVVTIFHTRVQRKRTKWNKVIAKNTSHVTPISSYFQLHREYNFIKYILSFSLLTFAIESLYLFKFPKKNPYLPSRRGAGTTQIFRDGVEFQSSQSGPGDRWETIKHDAVNNRRRRYNGGQENSASVPVHRQE